MTIDPAVSPVPAAPGRARAAAFPLLAVLLVVALAPASPAVAFPHTPQQAKLALAADRIAYDAGTTARLRARVTIATGWHVNSHQPTFDYLIPTALTLKLPAGWPPAKITYPAAQLRKFAFAEVPLAVYDGDALILAELAVPKGAAVGTYPVHAALFYQACNHDQCLPPVTAEADLPLKVGPGGRLVAALGGASAPRQRPPVQGLPLILALGLLGGLLLNVMPCVLPVLSLKIFGLVRSAGHGRAEVIRGALATAAGILISFWALAVTAIAARAAGLAVGWGVQFQRPGFVAFLALVVVLFCLNLWGLFEIPLPQRLARLGAIGASGARGPREGLAGHFASGLFATLMATPCSAPFLGTAVGFALAQEAPAILATFTAVGVGMALPYLLLAVAPASTRLLPRPGAWMEAVRGVMGFLLAAAAVWLFYVLAAQVSPERVALIELALLGMALFTWLHRRGALAAAGGERGAGLRRFAAGWPRAPASRCRPATGPNQAPQSPPSTPTPRWSRLSQPNRAPSAR